MLKSLHWKLTVAFVLIAFITTVSVAVLIRVTSADRLMALIIDQQRSGVEQALINHYAVNGSWDGVAVNWQEIQFRSAPTAVRRSADEFPQPADRIRRNMFGLADAQGIVIIPVDSDFPEGASLPPDVLEAGDPVLVDGVQVGTILSMPKRLDFNPEEFRYLQRTTQALEWAIVVGLFVALIMGFLLARTLTNPLKALTQASQRIAQGQLEQQVEVKSGGEIGQLADAFNRMSREISRVNQLRRQMTADIAHDLRTPLTVIAGYVESMRDGVLHPTPERLTLIYAEIERLQNLVGDLRMLSQVDAGELPLNPQRISPQNLLDRTAALFQNQAEQQNVTISVDAGDSLPEMLVDEERMMQVMHNLLSNAFRYTPPRGNIYLSARASKDKVEITVRDTGCGIEPQELPHIFNRFHRADKSRHARAGESGLGLPIVKALVEAHGGSVWAESEPEEGTVIHISLPINA